MNWEGTGRRSYIIGIPLFTLSGATKKNHEIHQSKQLISRPGCEEKTSGIRLTCSTDECDRLDDGRSWYTIHCYGFRERERERETARERKEAKNVIVGRASANLTALLFKAPSEGQDSEIALCQHTICPRSGKWTRSINSLNRR
jgi:hypothetical protein